MLDELQQRKTSGGWGWRGSGRSYFLQSIYLVPGLVTLLLLASAFQLSTVGAHDGEDHSADAQQPTSRAAGAAAIRSAERNVQTEQGNFRVRMRQTPTDPRVGEEARFNFDISERVEGGFGGGGPQLVEGATVTARITTAAGDAVVNDIASPAEGRSSYGAHHNFGDAGNYKIIFDVRTNDNRRFAVDFPVTIVNAPVNRAFWLGVSARALLAIGAVFSYSRSRNKDGMTSREATRRTVPVALAALVFFVLGTVTLAYFEPSRKRRAVSTALPPIELETTANDGAGQSSGDPALGQSGAVITISKESQLLFGIRTEPVVLRQIVSGLTTTGVVRARPDARALITPPVSSRIGQIAERLVLSVPEVGSTGRRTGRAELDEHAEGVHYTEIDVDLKESTRSREEVIGDVRENLAVIPGVSVSVGQPISHRIDHLQSGVRAQIAVKLFGDDLGNLRAKAEEIRNVMTTVEGATDVTIEKQVLIPQIRFNVNRTAAAQYGLQPGEVAETLETALNGRVVSEAVEGQRRYDVIVRFDDASRGSLDALKQVTIDTPQGTQIPVAAVADIENLPGPNQILRENTQRRIVVSANTADRDLGSVVQEMQQRIPAQVQLPEGYFIEYGGQFESRGRRRARSRYFQSSRSPRFFSCLSKPSAIGARRCR